MSESATELQRRKQEIRHRARARRHVLPDKDSLSRQICGRLAGLPEYRRAATVMFYVDFRAEVRTQHFLPSAWQQGKRVVVPYCAADRLELFRLESLDELAPGKWGIPEPKAELRGLARRKVEVSRLDLVVVPGVAFDRRGGRLGWGGGFYDRLLPLARPDTSLLALAFECQLFAEVPVGPQDVRMHRLITEKTVYRTGDPS